MKELIAEYWTQALELLENSYTEVVFNAWLKPLKPYDYDSNVFLLKTDDDFFKARLNQRYLHEITRCLRAVMNADVDVRVISPEDFIPGTGELIKKNAFQTNLRSKYTFETFVQGKSNQVAYGAALTVSESPGEKGYNPLFLYGGVGLGKTHLMHSIGNYIIEQTSGAKVYYVSSETFMNEFVAAIRSSAMSSFREKYRDLDVLLLDDVQFLEGKEETQEELFHTFNTLYGFNKQIVLTSDQPPKVMKGLEERLISRFAMGLNVDINKPDLETRMAILEKKTKFEKLSIPHDVLQYIAQYVVSNIRDLEGALNKVAAYSRLTHTLISMDMAEDALKDMVTGVEKPEITVAYIQGVVASYYDITVDDMLSTKRKQSVAFPRQVAMYLSRKILDMSLPLVGKAFGGRNHSTVIHSVERILESLDKDINLQRVIYDLERKIRS
ncbi:MAG: chromosomal replication initiator protein DnaA [Clostridiales bacterium]|jgi:chromosomal replication initiator protein|nr:chromosomal replication initiator protein DnaA [Clostridiales bacterium]